MKKEVLVLLFILLAIAFVKAEPVLILQQDKFQPGETLIGEIKVESGEFYSSVQESSIKFYEGRREILLNFELFPYENSYYFYAYITKEGNFTLKIENILYKDVEGILKSFTIERNITIQEDKLTNSSDTKILSIRPGIILTSSSANLILENKGNTAFEISYGLNSLDKDAVKKTLFPNRPEKLNISVKNPFSNIIISAYKVFSVPLIYNGNQIIDLPAKNKTNLKASKNIIQIKSAPEKQVIESLELFNFENNTISNLKILKSTTIFSIGNYNSQINGGEKQAINLSFYSNNPGFFKNNLTITFLEDKVFGEIIIPIEAYFLSGNLNNSNSSLKCAQKGGSLCVGSCDGFNEIASDGFCCFGICTPDKPENPSSGGGWVLGLVIIIILGAGGWFLYKKIKSTKSKPASALISDNTKSFEKRVSGKITRS